MMIDETESNVWYRMYPRYSKTYYLVDHVDVCLEDTDTDSTSITHCLKGSSSRYVLYMYEYSRSERAKQQEEERVREEWAA